MSFKNVVWRNTFLKKNSVSKLSILFLKSILCTPIDESFQNNQPFFEENKVQWRKNFLQNISFLSYHRSTALPLLTMLFKKNFWINNFLIKLFSEIYFSFSSSNVCFPLMNHSKPTNFLRKTNFIDENTFYKK